MPTPRTHEEELARYETADPTECPAKAYQGPSGEGKAGQRNETSLRNAFQNSPVYQLTPSVFKSDAKTKFSSYDGENTAYSLEMYRRNFTPVSSSWAEYNNVRDKNLPSIQLGDSGRPATPFSPNVASPTVPEGTLFAGVNQITNSVKGLNISEGQLTTAINELNPINSNYKNLDSLNHNNDVGGVRRFTLGVGSTVGKTRADRSR